MCCHVGAWGGRGGRYKNSAFLSFRDHHLALRYLFMRTNNSTRDADREEGAARVVALQAELAGEQAALDAERARIEAMEDEEGHGRRISR